jgi:hypothetical protein
VKFLDGLDMWHERAKKEMHTGFWCENLKERDHFEYLRVEGRIILNWLLKK